MGDRRNDSEKISIRQIQTELCCAWTCQTFRLLSSYSSFVSFIRSFVRSFVRSLVRCAKCFYVNKYIYISHFGHLILHTPVAEGNTKHTTLYCAHVDFCDDSDVAPHLISKIENCKISFFSLFRFNGKLRLKFDFFPS